MTRLPLFVLVLGGCAQPARFQDRAILWREPDRAPIPVPKEAPVLSDWFGLRDAFYLPPDRVLALEGRREAWNVNALDEVPDSTWFEDPRRISDDRGQVRLRAFSSEALLRGPVTEPPPAPPLTVVSGKLAGSNPGFVIEDARGRRYVIKVDPPGYIGLNTSTEVVVTRLYWAAGWKVPAVELLDLHPSQLKLSPEATTKDRLGDKVRLEPEAFAQAVASLPRQPDGTLRLVASRFIDGKILGPFAWFGRRADDPNDRVPHEHRRDLRAFGTFSAWVNNIDTLETNTLDAYVGEPGRGHVVHWQQDVGGAFGARALAPIQYWMGRDIYLAPSRVLASILTLGFLRRPWDDEAVRAERARLLARYPELGYFDAEGFDPRKWQPVLDNPAFARQTPRDRYWGAKRVLAFSPEELGGAITAGRYRDEAALRLYEVLWKRREKLARAFLSDVAPLDFFRFEGERLCFDDLWVAAGLGGEASTEYAVQGDGVRPQAGGRGPTQCLALQPKPGYRVVAMRVRRAGERAPGPAVRVHFVEGAGPRRIVGIERDAR